eukprot:8612681-Pyramimonas_sp.AAC.1
MCLALGGNGDLRPAGELSHFLCRRGSELSRRRPLTRGLLDGVGVDGVGGSRRIVDTSAMHRR